MSKPAPSASTETPDAKLQALPPIDPQDPLPESNWIPRRWSSFLVCIVAALLLLLVIVALWRIARPETPERVLLSIVEALSGIAGLLVAVIVIDRILLMVAPSAEQVVKMIQTAGLLVRGVTLRSETRTTARPDAAETVTTTTAEVPDQGAGLPPPRPGD